MLFSKIKKKNTMTRAAIIARALAAVEIYAAQDRARQGFRFSFLMPYFYELRDAGYFGSCGWLDEAVCAALEGLDAEKIAKMHHLGSDDGSAERMIPRHQFRLLV